MLQQNLAKRAYADAGTSALGELIPSTLSQRLQQKKQSLETELATVNDAIAKLEANPVIEEVLNFVSKVGMY